MKQDGDGDDDELTPPPPPPSLPPPPPLDWQVECKTGGYIDRWKAGHVVKVDRWEWDRWLRWTGGWGVQGRGERARTSWHPLTPFLTIPSNTRWPSRLNTELLSRASCPREAWRGWDVRHLLFSFFFSLSLSLHSVPLNTLPFDVM